VRSRDDQASAGSTPANRLGTRSDRGTIVLSWPRRAVTQREKWLVGLIALALFSLGFLALVVGIHDVSLRDEPLRVTATGGVIAAAGLLVGFAGVLLWSFTFNLKTIEVWSGRLVLAACWLVAIGAVYVLIAEGRSLTVDWLILAVAGVIFALAVAAFFFLEKVTLVTLGKVGAFLLGVIGTAFGVFQFWYQQEYLPTHRPPALSLTAGIESAGERPGRELYKATITTKNTGTVKVIAFTGTYVLSGLTYGAVKKEPTEDRIMAPLQQDLADPYYSRFLRHYAPNTFTPIAAGRLFAENRYFEPNDELSREYIVAAPRCRYALLMLRTNIVVGSGELLQLEDKPAVPRMFFIPPSRNVVGVFSEWHVKDDSWIHDVVDGKERWIQIVQLHSKYGSQNGYFDTNVWLRAGDKPSIKYTDKERHRLGLARTFADYELPVVDKNASGGASQPDTNQKPCPG
jgi:hypothetical protein